MLAILMHEHICELFIHSLSSTWTQSIYDHATASRNKGFPAGPDAYRSMEYERNNDALSSSSSSSLFTLRTSWWQASSILSRKTLSPSWWNYLTFFANCFYDQAIWDHSGLERKGEAPGSPDLYRSTVYDRSFVNPPSFRVVQSVLSDISDNL